MDKLGRLIRLQTLLDRQKYRNSLKKTSLLFDECIDALGDGTIILSKEKSDEVYKAFGDENQITFFGRVEWSLYEFEEIDLLALRARYEIKDETVYILWSHGSDPVIQVKINNVLEHFYDVTAVSPDIWMYKENECMIEIFHDGIIRRRIFK